MKSVIEKFIFITSGYRTRQQYILGGEGIMSCGRPSVNTYSAHCDICVLSGGISMKLVTSIHHVSGHCCKGSQG